MKLPRFTLRDLFWLLLVVAITCGWWLDRTRLAAETLRLRHEITSAEIEAVDREAGALLRQMAEEDKAFKSLQRQARALGLEH